MAKRLLFQVVLRSFASRNQLAVTEAERQRGVELEWERKLLTVLGVANQRKYEFRLQTDKNISPEDLANSIFIFLLQYFFRKLYSSCLNPFVATKFELQKHFSKIEGKTHVGEFKEEKAILYFIIKDKKQICQNC